MLLGFAPNGSVMRSAMPVFNTLIQRTAYINKPWCLVWHLVGRPSHMCPHYSLRGPFRRPSCLCRDTKWPFERIT